jgi:hypothetical protein
MSITERSEILSALYKVQGDLGAIQHLCQETRALLVAVSVEAAQEAINEAIEQFKPDSNEPLAKLEFPTPKF